MKETEKNLFEVLANSEMPEEIKSAVKKARNSFKIQNQLIDYAKHIDRCNKLINTLTKKDFRNSRIIIETAPQSIKDTAENQNTLVDPLRSAELSVAVFGSAFGIILDAQTSEIINFLASERIEYARKMEKLLK